MFFCFLGFFLSRVSTWIVGAHSWWELWWLSVYSRQDKLNSCIYSYKCIWIEILQINFVYHHLLQGVQNCLAGLQFGNEGKFGSWPLAKIIYKFGGKFVTNISSRVNYLIIGENPRGDRVNKVCTIVDERIKTHWNCFDSDWDSEFNSNCELFKREFPLECPRWQYQKWTNSSSIQKFDKKLVWKRMHLQDLPLVCYFIIWFLNGCPLKAGNPTPGTPTN